MIKLGLTGNIGCGKSTVARLFELLDVPVYCADKQARFISEQIEVLEEIEHTFGCKVFDSHGNLDRKQLASIVFNNAGQLALLNAIIHPRVSAHFTAWCIQFESFPYVVHESAILFESGLDYLCDKVIVVTAPEKLRLHRVMQRDNLSLHEVRSRMNNQWAESKLVKLSDFEIVNDDYTSLIEQVSNIDSLFKLDFIRQ